MDLLFATMPVPGHVAPLLPIARALIDRGHRVRWCTGRTAERAVGLGWGMKLGLALPQYGVFADPSATLGVAVEAEGMGFDSLWVGDRLILPTAPRDRYISADGVIPSAYENFLDPLTLLAAVATCTSRVRLGTSTLNALWQPPALLARTVTTLDRLSGGRIDLGIGWGGCATSTRRSACRGRAVARGWTRRSTCSTRSGLRIWWRTKGRCGRCRSRW